MRHGAYSLWVATPLQERSPSPSKLLQSFYVTAHLTSDLTADLYRSDLQLDKNVRASSFVCVNAGCGPG